MVICSTYRNKTFSLLSLSPAFLFDEDSTQAAPGTDIAQWSDQSGNGRNTSQPDTTRRPILEANAINGLPALRFAANDQLLLGDLSSVFAQAGHLFVVAQVNSDYYCIYNTDADDSYWRYQQNIGDGTGAGFMRAWSQARRNYYPRGSNQSPPDGFMPKIGNHLFEVSSSAAAYEVRVDGVSAGVQSGNHVGGVNHSLGAMINGNTEQTLTNGLIGAAVGFPRILNSVERAQVNESLRAKWGTP